LVHTPSLLVMGADESLQPLNSPARNTPPAPGASWRKVTWQVPPPAPVRGSGAAAAAAAAVPPPTAKASTPSGTLATEFLPPKPSSAASGLALSAVQAPSTTNLYWYWPGANSMVRVQVPSLPVIGLAESLQLLNSPARNTCEAPGAWWVKVTGTAAAVDASSSRQTAGTRVRMNCMGIRLLGNVG
jgi:hypothetical protein